MHVLIITQGKANLDRYKAQLIKRGHSYEELSLDSIPFAWKDGHPDWQRLNVYLDALYETRREAIDIVKFFLSDWKAARSKNDKPVLGRAYRRFAKYPVHLVKIRRDDDKTAEHEDFHTFDDVVRIYLGVSLAQIMGVDDFNEDVVHARDPRFTEYEYDRVWEEIAPYVEEAYKRRKQLAVLSLAQQALVLYRKLITKRQTTALIASRREQLFDAAQEAIGTDASPSDIAPDELGCAESVSKLIKSVLRYFAVVTGTWSLWDVLRRHEQFQEVDSPLPGDIIISPTGTGNGSMRGHTGIVGNDLTVLSNDSSTGTFEENYTIAAWIKLYGGAGGFPVHYYRIIN